MIETLNRMGLTTAIVCPGSRSTMLTIALVRHSNIETIPILDERSAAFFALGCAKRLHRPVAIVCTSGTAGANFYPAIIEAQESQVPLLIFTADRPPEMRACASGQAIDQQKLFGSFVNWYVEMAVPGVGLLDYARQTMVQAWGKAQFPKPGPVHLNCPFREPLSPLPSPLDLQLDETDFFAGIAAPTLSQLSRQHLPPSLWESWVHNERGIIVAGPAQPKNPAIYCQAVGWLSQLLGWPVLAEGLSPLRNYQSLNPYLISTYDSLLRNKTKADRLIPDQVIQLGQLPTSKVLRQWLQQHRPHTVQVTPFGLNVDPLHGRSQILAVHIEELEQILFSMEQAETTDRKRNISHYCEYWVRCDRKLSQKLNQHLTKIQTPFEGKISWLLSKYLPDETPVVIANSMPVRDIESFWQPNNRRIQPYFSRGANGIDGTLSTAMGIAHGHKHSLLLTGDLAFLHDTNGLLNSHSLKGALTIIVINNQGGGIFEMLPISDFKLPFEKYFATPQTVNISVLCKAYDIQYAVVRTWKALIKHLQTLQQNNPPRLKVLEFPTNRKADAQWRKTQIGTTANNLEQDPID